MNAAFNIATIREMCERHVSIKSGRNYVRVMSEESKAYMSKYFFKLQKGNYIFWNVIDDSLDEYTHADITKVFFKILPDEVNTWFFNEHAVLYRRVCELNTPRIDYANGKLNTFAGFKHEYKPYKSFSKEIRDSVDIFLCHIKEVICSDKEDQYNYVLKWFANIAHQNKNDSLLYIKGEEGTGKSTLTDMIYAHVFGMKPCLKSNTEPLRSKFNQILCGKILVIFEEMPTFSDAEWNGVTSVIKNAVTSDRITYEDKHIKAYEANNINNYVVISNFDPIKHSQGRRYAIADVSSHRIGDHEYFGRIRETCYNDEVGHALFCYLYEMDVNGFQAQRDMPETQSKLDAIADRLEMHYKFIKQEYILKNKSMKITLTNLHKEYEAFMTRHNKTPISNIEFNKKLKNVNINYKIADKGKNWIKMTHAELLEIAQKLKWIHELDEFESTTISDQGNFIDDDDTNKLKQSKSDLALMEENEELQMKLNQALKENEDLRKEIEQLKKVSQPKQEPKQLVDDNIGELLDDGIMQELEEVEKAQKAREAKKPKAKKEASPKKTKPKTETKTEKPKTKAKSKVKQLEETVDAFPDIDDDDEINFVNSKNVVEFN